MVWLVEGASQASFPAFVFQLVTLFIYNHELCHLHQLKDREQGQEDMLEERYNFAAQDDFNLLRHAMEMDADVFAATEIAYSVHTFWVKLPEKDRSTATLQFLVSLFGAAVFLVFYSLQGGWQPMYFLEHSHPHAVVRVTYVLDCITTTLQGTGEPDRPLSRDNCQVDTLLLADKLLHFSDERGLVNYWKMFTDNIVGFENYIRQHIVPMTRRTPWLVQPRRTDLIKRGLKRE